MPAGTKSVSVPPATTPGHLYVVAAPSGTGKTSLVRALMAARPQLKFSVSYTTRPMRPNEVDGRDYHFVDRATFEAMVERGELLEWARVFDNYYGTGLQVVQQALARGESLILEIDWQGAQQLYQQAGGDVIRVFIFPPSMEELERRLRSRGTDTNEVIDGRMSRASAEISHWDGYDYVLVNDDADACFRHVKSILDAERLKRSRQTGLIGFVRGLTKSVKD